MQQKVETTIIQSDYHNDIQQHLQLWSISDDKTA